MKIVKYLFLNIVISFFSFSHVVISGNFDQKIASQKYTKKEKKPLDECLYQPPTLKLRCLLALQSQNWLSANIPEEVRIGAIAFQNIRNNDYCTKDLKNAFHLIAPINLQEKVCSIDQRVQEKINTLELIDAAIFDQKHPSLFVNLFLMLKTHCQKTIDKGLIQLGRDNYRKKKVLYAILLHLGANINYYGTVRDEIRLTTPLITATIHKQISCVELLLKNKAKVHAKEEYGYTAYTLAKPLKINRDNDLIKLLRSYGGFFIPVNHLLCATKSEPESFEDISYNIIPGACSIQ